MGCGKVGQHIDEQVAIVDELYARTDTTILSSGHEAQIFNSGFGIIDGIRIQAFHHGIHSGLHQSARLDFVDVINVQFSEQSGHDFELFRKLEVILSQR